MGSGDDVLHDFAVNIGESVVTTQVTPGELGVIEAELMQALERWTELERSRLRELASHATQEKYQLRMKYGVGDVVIWDNASLLHSATLTDPQDPRTLWRITVKEEGRPS